MRGTIAGPAGPVAAAATGAAAGTPERFVVVVSLVVRLIRALDVTEEGLVLRAAT